MSFTYAKLLLLSFLIAALGACTPSQGGNTGSDSPDRTIDGTLGDATDRSHQNDLSDAQRKSLFIKDLVVELSADLKVDDQLPGPPEPNLDEEEQTDVDTAGTDPVQPMDQELDGVFSSDSHIFSIKGGRYTVSYEMKGSFLQEDGLFFESRGNLLFRPHTFACMKEEQDQVFFREGFEEALNNRLKGIIGLKEVSIEELEMELQRNSEASIETENELKILQTNHLGNLERQEIKKGQVDIALERLEDVKRRLDLNRDKKTLNDSEIQLIDSDLERLALQIEQAESSVLSIGRALSDLGDAHSKALENSTDLKAQVLAKEKLSADLQKQISKTSSEIEDSVKTAARLKEKWEGSSFGFLKRSRYVAWQEELARGEELRKKLEKRTNSLEILNEELRVAQKELVSETTKISQLDAAISQKNSELTNLQASLEKMTSDRIGLETQVSDIRTENQSLDGQIKNLASMESEAKTEHSELSSDLAEIKSLVREGERNIQRLSFEISQLGQQRNLLNDEVTKTNVQIKALNDLGFLRQDSYKLAFNFAGKDILELLSEELQLELMRTSMSFPFEPGNDELITCDTYFDSRIAYSLSKQQKTRLITSTQAND